MLWDKMLSKGFVEEYNIAGIVLYESEGPEEMREYQFKVILP